MKLRGGDGNLQLSCEDIPNNFLKVESAHSSVRLVDRDSFFVEKFEENTVSFVALVVFVAPHLSNKDLLSLGRLSLTFTYLLLTGALCKLVSCHLGCPPNCI